MTRLGPAIFVVAACSPAPPEPAPPIATIELVEAADEVPPPPIPRTGADLPTDLLARLDAHADCTRTACAVSLYPPVAPLEGEAPVAIWSQAIQPGGELHLAASSHLDLYGVVVSGTLQLTSSYGERPSLTLNRWSAFHAPSVAVVLTASPPATLVLALATRGISVRRALGQALLGGAPAARAGLIRVVDLAAAEDLSWAGGAVHARLAFESGPASLGLLIATAEAPVPEHDHPSSWEVIALLRADGRFRRGPSPAEPLADSPGDELHAGAVVAVPIGVRHAWIPSGKERLFAVQMYHPPGPEQRFKELAAQSAGQPAPRAR